jgi:hypothetical protein
MCGPFRITPSGFLLLMGTDGVRVAGAATMNYSSGYNADRGHCFLWYAIGGGLGNRRNPDFALTSTLPMCEPEVDRADIHNASDVSAARSGTWRPVAGGTGRQRAIHWIDA